MFAIKNIVVVICLINFHEHAMECERAGIGTKQHADILLKDAVYLKPSYYTFLKAMRLGYDKNKALGQAIGYYCQSSYDANHPTQVGRFRMIEDLLKEGANPNRFAGPTTYPTTSFNYTRFSYFDSFLGGGMSSMIGNIIQAESCKNKYSLVVLLLQYGLNKNELSTQQVLEVFDYKEAITKLPQQITYNNYTEKPSDTLKVYLLLFPELIETSFKDANKEARDVLERCKQEIQLDQGDLELVINQPENTKVAQDDIACVIAKKLAHFEEIKKEARSNIERTRKNKEEIKKYGGPLSYILNSQINNLPAKKKKNPYMSKKRSINGVSPQEENDTKRLKQEEN
jgi:hypothetical protein